MGVQLNIKDEETVRMARKLAGATGLSVTQVIRQALERELSDIAAADSERVERAMSIVRETRSMWKPEYDGEELSITYKDHLYDEHGLPK